MLRIKGLLSISVISIALLALFAPINALGQENPQTAFIKKFYSLYITQCDQIPFDLQKMEAIKSEHCTKKLIQKLAEQNLDYDPFLEAQDCDKRWIKTLSISKIPNSETNYEVTYKSFYNDETISIILSLAKEKDSYKIDSIKF